MVASVNNNNSSSAASAATSGAGSADLSNALSGSSSALGEQDFLTLLVAQLKNQDPLSPQDNTAFVAQLAQFSTLQATMGINTRLDTLSTQNTGLANTANVSLVGKTATVKGSIVTDDGSGTGVPLAFTLAGNATATTVSIQDSTGKVIRSINVGAHDAGLVRTVWDGKDDSGNVMPAGSYAVAVQATAQGGAAVSVAQETTGVVQSVAFDKGYPVLTLDNGVQVPVSDLISVSSSPNSNP
jgi:flagellar basal-body rod modification protein FlgD